MSFSDQPPPEPQRPEEILFAAALQRPAAERAAFLNHACRGDAALRRRLDALLAAHEKTEVLPDFPAEAVRPEARPEPAEVDKLRGQRIGRYTLIEKIGEGGCGVVYVAEQTEPVRRRVALKLIKPGMDSRAVIARFEAERQALALMDHPNIARVLDGGTTEAGLPFFVMELVLGMKITEHCDQHKLSTEERIQLFLPVCQAVQHAHQKGIIHRDLKPSNVFVTMHDGVAVPKVIDFGIAKAIGGELLTDKTVYTALDQFIGTPAYMSPEQAERQEQAIDARTDVYSLGVLFYELITGRTPFDTKALLESGFEHMLRIIREQEPPRPSARLSTLDFATLTSVAQVRRSEPPRLLHLIRGDLDWIAMKCLEKDRARRYETASDLAADLRRHLESRPIVARPPSAVYRLRKSVRRHRAGLVLAGAIALGLLAGLLFSNWPARSVNSPATGAKNLTPTLPSHVSARVPDWTVTNLADAGPGSLREAALNAKSGDLIAFAPTLSGQTIVLTSGEIILDRNLTIDASALADGIRLDGNQQSRLFNVASNTTNVVAFLTLTNGHAEGDGGAILNNGTLTVNHCVISGNATAQHGGGIASELNSLLTVNDSSIAGNRCVGSNGWYGGGIYVDRSRATVNQTTLTGNTCLMGGGGIWMWGTVEVNQCTVTANSVAGDYGAEWQGGGGICGYKGRLKLFNSIVAGNSAESVADLKVSLVALNLSGRNLTNGISRLAPLENRGGSVPTMPPLPGSPALDAGDDSATNMFTADPRGFPRQSGPHVDIGAAEANYRPVVTSTAGSGTGSLRWAIQFADVGAVITFATNLTGQTIVLDDGDIALDKSLDVDASALPGGIVLNASYQNRFFDGVNPAATNVLTALRLINGDTSDGAAIYSRGHLTLNRCNLSNNRGHVGAAIDILQNQVTLNDCILTNNEAAYGAAILNWGTLVANRTTFAGNHATYTGGGAIQNGGDGILELNQCTLASNLCSDPNQGYGGGIFNQGRATLNNTTVSANTAIQGGGIHNTGQLTLNNSIVAGNRADDAATGDLFGLFMNNRSLVRADPHLSALGNYGGFTPTMPPLPDSPAIDAGDDSLAASFATDQRGLPRRAGRQVDIGAVEFDPQNPPRLMAANPSVAPATTTQVVLNNADSGPGSLREVVAQAAPGSIIRFDPALSGRTIILARGPIMLDKNLTIDASGLTRGLAINGNHKFRIFEVVTGATVVVDSLLITNGYDGGRPDDANLGGAGIYNAGSLTVNRCTFAGNSAAGGGGGIGSRGPLTVNQCTFTGNAAFGGGGIAIYYFSGGTLALNQSTLTGNTAFGGAPDGVGGDLFSYVAPVTSFNSIVSDVHINQGRLELTGANLIQTYGAYQQRNPPNPTLITNAPLLAPLGNYGGPLPTMPPQPGSPVLDAGADSVTNRFATDQRGFPRRVGAHVDIGAVEAQ